MKLKLFLLGIALLCTACGKQVAAPTENNQKAELSNQVNSSSSSTESLEGIATPPPPPPAPPAMAN